MAQAEAQRRQAEQELKRVLSQKAAVEKAMADMDEKTSSAKGMPHNRSKRVDCPPESQTCCWASGCCHE